MSATECTVDSLNLTLVDIAYIQSCALWPPAPGKQFTLGSSSFIYLFDNEPNNLYNAYPHELNGFSAPCLSTSTDT